MSAARLDPFSARLHAIRLKGARAKAPEPTPQEEKAHPVTSTGVARIGRDDDDDGQGSMSFGPVNNEGQGSMSYVPINDDDEPPRPGHFGTTTIPRDYHEPESLRDATRRRAQDEDTQDQIRELKRRVEELESEMRTLNSVVDQLRRPVPYKWSLAGSEDE